MTTDLEDRQRARCAEVAATCAGFNVRRAARAVSQHFDHALAPAGLRMTQFTLLAALAIGGTPSLGELSDVLIIDRTTLSRNLKLLRDVGLVEAVSGAERRIQRFRLTGRGRSVLDAALPLWQAAQDELVVPLGTDRWRAMLADLGDLIAPLRPGPLADQGAATGGPG